jgi:hypothetical protein
MDDHTLLPGIETGDIGPKIGYNNMDNGYARFDNVRIPRRNMAMRFAMVDEEGNYKKVVAASSSINAKEEVGGSSANSDAASKVACEFYYILCSCLMFGAL